MANNDTKYKETREKGLNWLGKLLPDALGGGVAKEKQKHKKALDDAYKNSR